MRWLIFGASGFVGRHLFQRLRVRGEQVAGTSRSPRDTNQVAFDLEQDRLCDRFEPAWFEVQPVVAVHCVSFGAMDRCVTEHERSWRVEVEQTRVLMRDLDQLGARQVYMSSSYVFDGERGNYREEEPCHPTSEYGRHKVEMEQFLGETISSTLVLRLDKVIGDSPAEAHLFTEWWRAIQEQRPLRCLRDQIFTPILVDDVVRAVDLLVQAGRSGTYHVAGAESVTRAALARRFCAALRAEATIVEEPADQLGLLDRRPHNSSLDISRLRLHADFDPCPLQDVIANFIRGVTT